MFTKLQVCTQIVKTILPFRERGLSLVAQSGIYSFTTAAPTGEKRRSQFQKYANKTYISPQRHEIRMNSEDLRHILEKENRKDASAVESDLYWKGYNEGTSRALISKHSYLGERKKLDEVNYNQAEILQRDITLLVMQEHIETLKSLFFFFSSSHLLFPTEKPKYEPVNILLVNPESGIKAMRILKELNLPDIKNLILAGTNKAFPEFVQVNSIANQLTQEQESKMKCLLKDPKEVMFESRSFLPKDSGKYKYQIIDIECTGSSLPYVDYAIQALDQDGLLCLTFTDLKVLTGSDYQKAYYYYGSTISKTDATHENGIRVAYHAINTIANKSFKSITPVFSYFEDFYFRLYLRVNNNKTACAHSIVKTGNVLTCSKCPSYKVLPLGVENKSWKGETLFTAAPLPKGSDSCDECGSPNFLNGPIWIDQLNDFDFVKDIYTKLSAVNAEEAQKQYFSYEKVQGLLYAMLKEKELGKVPLPVNFEAIAAFLQLKSKPNKFLIKNASDNQNYKITRSYLYKSLWKTDAPLSVAFDLLKFWRKNGEAKEIQDQLEENSTAANVMKKPIKHFPNFKENIALIENAESVGQDQEETVKIPTTKDEDKALFFQKPTPTWGHMKRVVVPKKPKNQEEKN